MDQPDALILAAGTSSRMGHFKPLMKFDGKPFLIHILDKIDTLVKTVCIVTGYQSTSLEAMIRQFAGNYTSDIMVLHNPDYNNGMFSSLKTGLSALDRPAWILYHFVDQPHIPGDFYPRFIRQTAAPYEWIQPVYRGKKGHPLLFSMMVAETICNHPDSSNLKAISRLQWIHKCFWECSYPEILEDFDTREDLKYLS